MTKKTQKTTTKPKRSPKPLVVGIDPHKKLLARVAGDVAAGLVGAPSPSISSSDKIATVAVDIAEQILRKVGIAVEVSEGASETVTEAAS